VWLQWAQVLAQGLEVTLELTAVVSTCTILLSLVVASAALSEVKFFAKFSRIYCDVLRSIPLLPFLIFAYYGVGKDFAQIGLSTFWLTAVVFILVESGYQAEVFRGIFLSVAAGQWEAGRSLGLRWRQIVLRVLIPSCMPAILPVSVNAVVFILKDTSLASIVTLNEVTLAATTVVSTSFRPLQVYILLGGFYLAVVLPIMAFARLLEHRLQRTARKSGLTVGPPPGWRRDFARVLSTSRTRTSAGGTQ
jgi:glutamine transport system permease protein